ncbi:MAG: hypothetical protein QOF30_1972 [Acidimicrobiaceae bacterium]|nr:hypothetical protein [Acidimicrobiaceae bacterium]
MSEYATKPSHAELIHSRYVAQAATFLDPDLRAAAGVKTAWSTVWAAALALVPAATPATPRSAGCDVGGGPGCDVV